MKTITPNLTAMSENNNKVHREIWKKGQQMSSLFGHIHT